MLPTFINPLNTSLNTWLITLFCAFLIGVSKSGLKGTAMVSIPLLAYLYGGKASVGIILPFLIMGDLMALTFYFKSGKIKYIIKLIPWAVVGILIAVYVGNQINDQQFKLTIAIAIIVCLALLLYNEIRKKKINLIDNRFFSGSLGLAGGFATMMGNAAGPIFNLYLLSMRLPKEAYIGTGAWFYLFLNVFKVPFHIISWQTITFKTIQLNFIMFPALLLGAFVGKKVVSYIPEKEYRYLIYSVILLSAILLFF
ncbi:sulfite exporter TauE/SafE family protein [Carboxylicivirga linearis]|uniref:Probable membrane transporter protein n=1 Tax=Carboxylicivirga linearis TaxID=1628157 RepID=A0ABS5JV77_9BACT|nr:sulfite exporter TauE/SafE family protein [Carboxylicivirga linearis]MBS2098805.1 sulfite exporter TauE/SafE family protein [Carboxylicivirga linearis]